MSFKVDITKSLSIFRLDAAFDPGGAFLSGLPGLITFIHVLQTAQAQATGAGEGACDECAPRPSPSSLFYIL